MPSFSELFARVFKRGNGTASAEQLPSARGRMTLAVTAIGLGFVYLYASQFKGTNPSWAAVASAGTLLAGASLVLGALLGFLFGIPRTLQYDRVDLEAIEHSTQHEAGDTKRKSSPSYAANTNLEQISDWLTKILVGVGLTQLTKLPDAMGSLSIALAPGLGRQAESGTFGVMIVVFFAVDGFLYGYLWTRLYLPAQFRRADVLSSLNERVAKAEAASIKATEVSEQAAAATEGIARQLEEQAAHDAKALALVARQLTLIEGAPAITPRELEDALREASPSMRVLAFDRAYEVRTANWQRNKELMERTIPVFRALVAIDVNNEYHRNHGQLGYALKDQRSPDWKAAQAELSEAIRIRGEWRTQGWLFYEFNRALCRIMLDAEFKQGRVSNPETVSEVMRDLQVATKWSKTARALEAETEIQRWLRLNKQTV
jgi:hypothetical protein